MRDDLFYGVCIGAYTMVALYLFVWQPYQAHLQQVRRLRTDLWDIRERLDVLQHAEKGQARPENEVA